MFPELLKTPDGVAYDQKAIGKLRALVESAKICMFTTSLIQWPLESRPADWQAIDANGDIWFFNGKLTADQVQSTEPDAVVPHVQVFYSNAGKSEFLSLIGNAMVSKEIPERFMQQFNMVNGTHQLIRFIPIEAYYWDNTYNTMLPLLRSVA